MTSATTTGTIDVARDAGVLLDDPEDFDCQSVGSIRIR
jgi:hypothetical protein